jgi:hypothetical protein
MEGFGALFLLCSIMMLVSFLVGSLPLKLSLSEKYYPSLTCFAVGLLVGCVLLILPESISTFYDAARMMNPGGEAYNILSRFSVSPMHHPQKTVGFILSLGFMTIILLEHVLTQTRARRHVAISNLAHQTHEPKRLFLTMGLVVHAATGGVVLGVISRSTPLGIFMSLAMIWYRASLALGLSIMLLHEKYMVESIRRHILAFAVATPLMALATFSMLVHKNPADKIIWEGYSALLVIFSTGAFLYIVLIEVLPVIYDAVGPAGISESKRILSMGQLTALVGGIFGPFLFVSEYRHHS